MIEVHDFVQVYVFDFGDGRTYTPTDRDKAMIEDAINGYVGECEQVGTAIDRWRPIATAPHDGNDILICHAETGDQMVVFYDEPSSSAPEHCWHRTDGMAYHRDFPTHWMPLPILPTR